jgi:hypothetical protein
VWEEREKRTSKLQSRKVVTLRNSINGDVDNIKLETLPLKNSVGHESETWAMNDARKSN